MTPVTTVNMATSVRQRLLNKAREQRTDFNLMLTRYGLERFLYRLCRSAYSDRFVLKGAMLFPLWGIAGFVLPPLSALSQGMPFTETWPAGGTWHRADRLLLQHQVNLIV
ncbi:MAG: hypothetical protein WBI04_00070 [Trichlorobacter sp.]